jgi:hypothetical protein
MIESGNRSVSFFRVTLASINEHFVEVQ